MSDDWEIDIVENTIGKVPIIGTPIAAVILFLIGAGYLVFNAALIGLVLIPYRLIVGVIDPEKALGKFPFESPRDYFLMSRLGFFIILLFGYLLPFGAALYFIFFSRT